jgi:hypothetical protein
MMQPNPLAGVVAGCMPEFIEMMQVGISHESGGSLHGRYTSLSNRHALVTSGLPQTV